MILASLPLLLMLIVPASTSLAFSKVIVFFFENQPAGSVLANPEFKSLADRGLYLSNYYAVTHPSQPNYIATVAGDTLGTPGDAYVSFPPTVASIANLLQEKGLSWKAYAENYPGNCFNGVSQGLYHRKHNPLQSFEWVRDNHCNHIVNASELQKDVAAGQLPAFSWYTPNINDDAHNTDIKYAGKWLKTTLEPLLMVRNFTQDTLIVLTWDEDDGWQTLSKHLPGYGHGNHIYAALLGSNIPQGAVDNTRYNHYSLLRTIEHGLGLGNLGRNDLLANIIGESAKGVSKVDVPTPNTHSYLSRWVWAAVLPMGAAFLWTMTSRRDTASSTPYDAL